MAYPALVLVHGFLGFSHCGPIEYFRGVKRALHEAHKITPFIPQVPTAGSIAMRAETLARRLFQTGTPSFALLGHSMGGLDARYLITYLDPDRRIKSLVTISTPHRGTPLAEWALRSRGPIPAWIRHIGKPGLSELTPEARGAMPIQDREDVSYSSYASCRPLDELPFWLRPYGRVIPEDNDGMVPVTSAQWGKFRGTVHADHLELIGWSLDFPNTRSARPFDHIPFWTQAAAEALASAKDKTG